MSWKQIKKLNEDRGDVLKEMRSILSAAETEKRDLSAEENAKFDELNTRAESLAGQVARYEKMAAAEGEQRSKGNQPGREDFDASQEQRDEQVEQQRSQFNTWLRSGDMAPVETRAITVDGTGVVGVRDFRTQLVDKMKSYVGVREAGAEVVNTSTRNELGAPIGDDTSNEGELLGEGVESDEDDVSPTLGYAPLRGYKFYSKPIPVSFEFLLDAAFDAEGYITGKAAERIGRTFNRYTTNGTGNAQPQGVVAAATVGKVAVSGSAITYEELLDLIHSVDPAYRQSPNFGLMLNDTTLAAIRKMKADDGSYIWAAGAVGAPFTILGYRYTINNSMQELTSGASSKVVAAGDFSRYLIRDVASPQVIRDPYTQAKKGMVLFHVYSFHDGRLLDNTAVKTLALAA